MPASIRYRSHFEPFNAGAENAKSGRSSFAPNTNFALASRSLPAPSSEADQ